MGEHLFCTQGVKSSNLLLSTISRRRNPAAKNLENRTMRNPKINQTQMIEEKLIISKHKQKQMRRVIDCNFKRKNRSLFIKKAEKKIS